MDTSKESDQDSAQMGSPSGEEETDQKEMDGVNVENIKSTSGPSTGTENCEELDGSVDLPTYHESMNIESDLSGKEGDKEVESEREIEIGHFNDGEVNDAEPSSQNTKPLNEKVGIIVIIPATII